MPKCPSYDEAAAKLDAAIAAVRSGEAVKVGDDTLVGFGLEVLAQREANGLRGVATERSRWTTHVEPFFAGRMLREIRRPDVVAFRDELLRKQAAPGHGHKRKPRRKISRITVRNVLSLLRLVLEAARELERIKSNPAADVKLPREEGVAFDPWTYLLLGEQRTILACASPAQADLIAFALSTGLRQGEQWSLRIQDIDRDTGWMTVRFGSKGKPRKSGRILRQHLQPMALAAVERQIVRLAEAGRAARERAAARGRAAEPFNPAGLLWPNGRGQRRSKGEPSWWPRLLARCGILAERRHDSRPVRWHDLRHTCASSLVSGWYTDQPWPLEHVSKHLGHRSITMTQRYAHLADQAVARSTSPWRDRALEILSHLGDLNPGPTVYEREAIRSGDAGLPPLSSEIVARCAAALQAYAEGSPFAGRMAIDALGAIVEAAPGQRRRGAA